MSNEAADRSGEARNRQGNCEGGAGEQSPLQARAEFLKNWRWELVARLNQRVCERGRAQHRTNSESITEVKADWERKHVVELSLAETLDYLRSCHRRAPFLFFNGNTFAEIARTFSDYLFAEFP